MIDISLVILCTAIGLVFGIIVGAVWLVIKVILAQKKALKEYGEGKIMKTKMNLNEIPKEKIDNSPQEKLGVSLPQQSSSRTNSEEMKISKDETETALEDTNNKGKMKSLEKDLIKYKQRLNNLKKIKVQKEVENSPQEKKLGELPTHQSSSFNDSEEGKVSKKKEATLEDSYDKKPKKSYSEKKKERRKRKENNKKALSKLFGKKDGK